MEPHIEPHATINNYVDVYYEEEEDDGGDETQVLIEGGELLIPKDISIRSERGHSLGQKSISTIGSFIFIVNQIYGPGVLSIPVSIDQFFLLIFKKTFALNIYPHFEFLSTDDITSLYTSGSINITIGYLLICLISIPTSFMNLDDNVKIVQTLSFIFLFLLLAEFIIQFILNGLELDRVPVVGDNFGQLVSVFIFSWAYPMFIPSWVNEKKDSVSVNKVVWASGVFSWFGYLFIGLLCALSYHAVNFIIPFIVYLKATSSSSKLRNNDHDNNNNNIVNEYDRYDEQKIDNTISPVQPYPKRFEKYNRHITKAILLITVTVCLSQIVYDIVLSVQGHDILDH
ncbi:hypothetical protein PPL_09081 [Heterostelium album PN500]|uniref:Amino acid transporter transmembrane domain-containing protein n=1 Tax=Heterostelium pallidum (strain ATCC 26659 / Pp 5 / PN500) TaxID=670386 RepID=D3BKJ9_HETP5|nr:hypothetical protein PPL_09081 [Heterostelium album PN500]EFA78429.1 hypothetical protein PPL_09081 [Heterostelium album PN500]|eukprot:XP_020430554.1 hypothetical protein PPL_09081 [Heterostelium album PN500]